MDLSCFSDDSFDIVKWINNYFESNGNKENKDVIVPSLVSRLQIYVEQMNSSLEKSSQQIMVIMPHAIKDIKMIQSETETLLSKMRKLQNEISQVNSDTEMYMHELERMERVFQKIRLAKYGMQESDGWGKLTVELDDLLERNDVFGSIDKFRALKKSISAQAGLPGQADRELQFEYFTNRLEALISPAVINCFQQGDAGQCLKYVEIFKVIDRLPHLRQCYRTVHKNALLEKWGKFVETENDYEVSVLGEYNNILLEFVQTQQKWCKQVFLDDLEPLKTIIDTLVNLRSSKESFVVDLLKKSMVKFEILSNLIATDCHFAYALEKTLKNHDLLQDTIKELSLAIFQYTDIFIQQYPALEESFANDLIRDIKLDSTNIAENISELDNCNSKVGKWFTEAIQRCKAITQNQSLLQLMKIFQKFTRNYIDKFTKLQKQIISKQFQEHVNWHLLQLNINLLQHLGDFLNTIQHCERQILSSLESSDADSPSGSIWNERLLHCNKKARDAIQLQVTTENLPVIFPKEVDLLRKVSTDVHDNILRLVLSYIEAHFKQMEFSVNKHNEDLTLPDYSYAPQEYITQIGQYLLTLPQHLEPLLFSPSPSLKLIMEFCEAKYKSEKACVDILLALIVDETTAVYQEKIDEILSLSASGAKQLAADIEYFGNVLEEMNLALSNSLQQTILLLRAPLNQYNAASSGCNPRLVSLIRQKRNIVSC